MERISPEDLSIRLRAAAALPAEDGEHPNAARARRVAEIDRLIAIGVSCGYLRHPHHVTDEHLNLNGLIEAQARALTRTRIAECDAAREAITDYMLKV